MSQVRLDRFDARVGLQRGRPAWVEAGWYVVKLVLFLSAFPWPMAWKRTLLRSFGATVGTGVVIKPRINILFPWKLRIGDHSWIGEEAWILNFEPICIGAHVCISQRVFLCGGNHDYRRPQMPFRNRPIVIEDGAWVGAQSFVGPGVIVGSEAVVTAGSVVTGPVPAGMVCGGNPCRPLRERWPKPGQVKTAPEPGGERPGGAG